MAVTFPTSPTNGQTFTANGLSYVYNATYGVWRLNVSAGGSSGGGGVTTYATVAELPLTNNTNGDMAFVEETDRLYLSNDNGWFNIALINTSPTITNGGTGSYVLATDGTPTVITLTATDPEEVPLTWSYTVTSGALGTTATVSQADNVFTITPGTTDPDDAGTFEITFSVTDGTNIVNDVNSFSLEFITIVENSKYTTALITTDGTSGTNTNIVDSSSNALTITPSGTPSSQSFSPYRSGGYSVQLDGTSGWIDTGVADNFGTGDVTFECWVKTTGGGIMLAKYQGGSVMEAFQITTTGGKMASHTASGTEGEIGTKDLRDNQWHHLVFERYNGTYYYYADGELQGTVANTENAVVGGNWIVGKHGTANIEWYDGQIRDLKLTVGTAVYGGSTPSVPTEPVTIDGSESLVLFTGIPYGKDLSPNNGTLTINGGVTFVPEGPYDYDAYDSATHGGSIHFDGSSYLQNGTAYGSIFDYSSSIPFTIDMWFYPTTSGTSLHIANMSNGTVDANLNWLFRQKTDNTLRFVMIDQSGTVVTCDSTDLMNINAWNHVAVVMTGTSIKHWLNGAFQQEVSFSGSKQINGDVQIGQWANNFYQGYIADFRWNVGEQVYTGTADITPPTAPLSSTNATLHVKGTGANIIDKSQTNTLTLVGNTTASTTRAKYTTSSIYMDGTGYVELPAGSINISGSQDYTIEGWINFNSIGGDQGIFHVNWPGNNLELIMAYWNGWTTYINGSLAQDTSVTPTTNQWYHIAVSRESGTVRVFLDGNIIRTVNSDTTAMENMGLVIGGYVSTSYLSDAYFEDWRVTKGLARYTANFTPPTASLDG